MSRKNLKKSIRSPRQKRSAETTEAILQAAAQILAKAGASKLTTNAIAERAGVSIGAVYQYFQDKEDILRTLCLRERQKDNDELAKCMESHSHSTLTELVPALLRVALDRSLDAPVVRQIIAREIPQIKTKVKAMQIQLAQKLFERLTPAEKERVPADMEDRFFVLISGIESTFYAAIEKYGNKLDKEMLIEETAAMVSKFFSRMGVR